MGVPLHMQVGRHPATSCMTTLLLGMWVWLQHHRVAPEAVGLSYQRFWIERQWWRGVTAQVCHFDLLHLVLNVSSLLSLAERAEPPATPGASIEYVRISVLLLLGSGVMCIALHHVFVTGLHLEMLRHSCMVGYSGVLFGWMTFLAWRHSGHKEHFRLLGLASVPMTAAPFLLLVLTQLIVPRAAFLGHLAGILMGLLLATGCLDWLTPYWTFCLVTWVAIGICYGLIREGRLGLPYVRLLSQPGQDDDDDQGELTAMEVVVVVPPEELIRGVRRGPDDDTGGMPSSTTLVTRLRQVSALGRTAFAAALFAILSSLARLRRLLASQPIGVEGLDTAATAHWPPGAPAGTANMSVPAASGAAVGPVLPWGRAGGGVGGGGGSVGGVGLAGGRGSSTDGGGLLARHSSETRPSRGEV